MESLHPVRLSVWTPGGATSHGRTPGTFSDPQDRMVYGWAVPTSDEPKTVGENRLVVDLVVYAPWTCSDKDRITILGRDFEVTGEPEDYNRGPFGWQPGYVINCRRIRG